MEGGGGGDGGGLTEADQRGLNASTNVSLFVLNGDITC